MPRTISSGLLAAIQSRAATISKLVLLTRTDGVVLGFTDNSAPIIYSGVTYEAMDGVKATVAASTVGAGIDNSDVQGVLSSGRIAESDLMAGTYDNARYQVMLINRKSIGDGVCIQQTGYIGEVTYGNLKYKAGVRGLTQVLHQVVGDVSSKECRCVNLGDSCCKLNLTPFTFARTVSAIGVSSTAPTAGMIIGINCGGAATGSWVADIHATGGAAIGPNLTTVDISHITNPAPQLVYQYMRGGYNSQSECFKYVIPGFNFGNTYGVRLHLNEPSVTHTGARSFNISAQGDPVVYTYDIFQASGARDVGVTLDFDVVADNGGDITLVWADSIGNPAGALVCGIEIDSKQLRDVSNGINFGADSAYSSYYDRGDCVFTSGANAGRTYEIETHLNVSGDAYISLRQQPIYPVAPGDTANLIAGCNRQFPVCAYKFDNAINNHSEPDLPGNNAMATVGR